MVKGFKLFHTEQCCTLFNEMFNSFHPAPSLTRALLLDNFGFKQLISEPTRETVSTKTLIYQIETMHPKIIIDSGVVQLAISDHYLIYSLLLEFLRKLHMSNFMII